MSYPNIPDFQSTVAEIIEYVRLKAEYGNTELDDYLLNLEQTLKDSLEKLKGLAIDTQLAAKEPDTLSEIRRLRPDGPRKLWNEIPDEIYKDKLEGALISRLAGCTLGAPVEFHSVEHMKRWAEYTGDAFPPTDYWSRIKFPSDLRYEKSPFQDYTRDGMHKVPVDDDITYTLLGLLIAEEYGIDFTTEDVGKAWLKYLPYACTAEDIALKNLKKGISALHTADVDNPYCQWIGADIRSDPFAYMAPGYPQKAAELAYRDAYLSHRRNGIYGEMFFAAAQSAAFCVDDPIDAIRIGLTEIPADCALAKDVAWALEVGKNVHNYQDARDLVDSRFRNMSAAHTNNNACLTIFGLMLGGTDMTKVISETVAMGMDNDCTAATAGSIVGAIVGKKNISPHWYTPFHNTVDHYLTDVDEMKIDDVVSRFFALAHKIYESDLSR